MDLNTRYSQSLTSSLSLSRGCFLALSIGLSHLIASLPASAQEATPFEFSRDGQIALNGHATLCDWACNTPRLTGTFLLPVTVGGIEQFFDYVEAHDHDSVDAFIKSLMIPHEVDADVNVELVIDDLDCGNKAMESDMREALRSKEYPVISYRFMHVAAISPCEMSHDGTATFHTEGELSVGGVARHVNMDVIISRTDHGIYRLQGVKLISMHDYEITPPTALFGLIRADDKVLIEFDVKVESHPSES